MIGASRLMYVTRYIDLQTAQITQEHLLFVHKSNRSHIAGREHFVEKVLQKLISTVTGAEHEQNQGL